MNVDVPGKPGRAAASIDLMNVWRTGFSAGMIGEPPGGRFSGCAAVATKGARRGAP